MINYEISAENIPQNSQASSPDWSEKWLFMYLTVHVSLLQVFDHEDLDDYQGDGQGQSSGITPEEYRGEPIVSQTLMTLLYHYAL